MKMITSQIIELQDADLSKKAEEFRVPLDLVEEVAKNQKLTVPNFAAGGIATPADASLMMQLGAETVFVGSVFLKAKIHLKELMQLLKLLHILRAQKMF